MRSTRAPSRRTSWSSDMADRISTCPKSMRRGPCGGADRDGGCEVDGRPCPFLVVPPQYLDVGMRPVEGLALDLPRPWILVDTRDLHDDPRPESWADVARALEGCTALIGEHADRSINDVAELLVVVEVLAEHGVPCIVTVTGRDRSLDQAGELIARLGAAGVLAVHCVTGDHPAAVGIDRPARWGSESFDMITAGALAGVPVTVAESPASPGPRASRLAAKQDAGASAVVLNHCGGVDDLVAFAANARDAGWTRPLVAPVPMIATADAARRLARFPGLRLPDGLLDAITHSTDPVADGLRAAAELTASIAASGSFQGINLSGPASDRTPLERRRMTTRFVDVTRQAWQAAPCDGAR